MSGLPCAKTIIDQREKLTSRLTTMNAGLAHGLGCMSNSITLNAATGRYPTEAQETDFLTKSAAVIDAVRAPMDALLACAAGIASSVAPPGSGS